MYLKIHVWLDVNITLCTRPMPKRWSVPKPCRWFFNSLISNESMEFYTQRTVDMACSFPKRSAAYLHDLHPTDIIWFHIIDVLHSRRRLCVWLKIWEICKTNRGRSCMPWYPVSSRRLMYPVIYCPNFFFECYWMAFKSGYSMEVNFCLRVKKR